MSIICDLIVVGIVALFAFLSSKKGFVRTLVEVVGFVLAAILACSLSTPLSTGICEKTILPVVKEATYSALENATTGNISDISESVWDELPDFVLTAAESSGITKQSVSEHLETSTADTIEGISNDLSNRIFLPIILRIVKTVVTFLLFVVFLVVALLLARVINKLFSGMIFGRLNSILGGVLGAIKGLAIASIFCLVISLLAGLTKEGFLSITTETIDSTYIVSAILNLLSL